jgi:tyrosinase
MYKRRNVLSLSAAERKQLVDAFLKLKKSGHYDHFVHDHHHAMMKATPAQGEQPDVGVRNAAHRGPVFFPWHREYLRRLEDALGMALPYWDWTDDAAAQDPTQSSFWGTDLMGGDGMVAEGYRVGTGPFAYKTGHWNIPVDQDGPALRRRFGSFPNVANLPTKADVGLAFVETIYDTAPWNRHPGIFSFRNRVEGWVTKDKDPRIPTNGSQTHNRVHLWVGGEWQENKKPINGSMVVGTSPNDPVFFLHHAFVDKIWAEWQAWRMKEDPRGAPHYAPMGDGPLGHNIDDELFPWGTKIRSLMDHRALGYEYDSFTDWSPHFPKGPEFFEGVLADHLGPMPELESEFSAKAPR